MQDPAPIVLLIQGKFVAFRASLGFWERDQELLFFSFCFIEGPILCLKRSRAQAPLETASRLSILDLGL